MTLGGKCGFGSPHVPLAGMRVLHCPQFGALHLLPGIHPGGVVMRLQSRTEDPGFKSNYGPYTRKPCAEKVVEFHNKTYLLEEEMMKTDKYS